MTHLNHGGIQIQLLQACHGLVLSTSVKSAAFNDLSKLAFLLTLWCLILAYVPEYID